VNRVRRNCPEHITQEMVRGRIDYNPETGAMVWRNGICAGKEVCPTPLPTGYRRMQLKGQWFGAHRVAWLYVYGYWPQIDLDHINGDRADNRIANLRECTTAENQHNRPIHPRNTTGVPGVTWQPHRKRFQASIRINGRMKHLGRFKTVEEAGEAYRKAKALYHPFAPEVRQ